MPNQSGTFFVYKKSALPIETAKIKFSHVWIIKKFYYLVIDARRTVFACDLKIKDKSQNDGINFKLKYRKS